MPGGWSLDNIIVAGLMIAVILFIAWLRRH
jgi:hypothetical protein